VILKLTIIEIIVDANDVTLSASSKVLRPLINNLIVNILLPIGASSPYQILDGGSLNVIKLLLIMKRLKEVSFQGRLIKL
jgi:hypothetical protein